MSITHLSSLSQLNGILLKSKDKLSVIDFHATWCGPCHAIAPTYDALSKKYRSVNFLKCDVDAVPAVAQQYAVSAMPTFIFLKGSSKIDQVKGADKYVLENTIRKHASPSNSTEGAFSGKGHTLGGDDTSSGTNVVDEVKQSLGNVSNQLGPEVKFFLGLVGLYLVFWYLG